MALRILVVERDVHAREGLRSILSSDGHAVSVADDIWAGFARVAVQSFDLLVLDDDVRRDRHEAMFVTDLLTFARRKHADTRGIVLSTFEEDVQRYQREDGVLAVLEKPVEVPRLRRELEGLTPFRASGSRD